jgi:acetyltransferase-like isoleucine patch superfamily enzyme
MNLYAIYRHLCRWYTRYAGRSFHRFGVGSVIHPPLNVNNPGGIAVGAHVVIGSFSWIGVNADPQGNGPHLVIEDGCSIGAHAFIHAKRKVYLHRNVILAPRVYIADHHYDYRDPGRPVMHQAPAEGRDVVIEEDCFLGIGSCVMKGVVVGKHSVIGANAVVTSDVPPYSIVVGNPGRIVRRFDPVTANWMRVGGREER